MTHAESSPESSRHGIYITFNNRIHHSNQSSNSPVTMTQPTQRASVPRHSEHNTLVISKIAESHPDVERFRKIPPQPKHCCPQNEFFPSRARFFSSTMDANTHAPINAKGGTVLGMRSFTPTYEYI
ncbi:hypothetical protein CDAR_515961 [Caerostris darwini]|uniref:Uncharacterized protein n=1 Tax=Caerostris darwini TaxID=1538125 RepID=A0AAV4NIV7_9ARAC|nr:hypothetical protein CDAR_515961 [Caerostris darwini]